MIDTAAHLEGKAGRAWLVPEPHPGHFLVHLGAPRDGLLWFLVSVDIDPRRVVLRAVDPAHEPKADEDVVLLEEVLIEVEVPEAIPVEDFVQVPGEVTRAILRDLLVPSKLMAPQWKAVVSRTLQVLRRRRRAIIDQSEAAAIRDQEGKRRKRKAEVRRRRVGKKNQERKGRR
jgi:hypothetical protein